MNEDREVEVLDEEFDELREQVLELIHKAIDNMGREGYDE
tara:strand:+ start:1025 stop:1144 length:120 start_codon:yes stop_codon:yes gene_type:complete